MFLWDDPIDNPPSDLTDLTHDSSIAIAWPPPLDIELLPPSPVLAIIESLGFPLDFVVSLGFSLCFVDTTNKRIKRGSSLGVLSSIVGPLGFDLLSGVLSGSSPAFSSVRDN